MYKCEKVAFGKVAILQYKIAKRMNNNENKYSIEWIKGFKGLENLTDEQAKTAIESLQSLTTAVIALNSHNMNDKESEIKLKQAA